MALYGNPLITDQGVSGSEQGMVVRPIGAGTSGSMPITGTVEGEFFEPVPVYVYDTGSYFFGASGPVVLPTTANASATIGVLWHPSSSMSMQLKHIEVHGFGGSSIGATGQFIVYVTKVLSSGTGGSSIAVVPGRSGTTAQTLLVSGSTNPTRDGNVFIDGATEQNDLELIINFSDHELWIMAGETAGVEIRTVNASSLGANGPQVAANFSWEEF